MTKLAEQRIPNSTNSIKKQPQRLVTLPDTATDSSILDTAKNAALGMALSYADGVDRVLRPIYFLASHLGSVLAALLHFFIPLAAAWFASHWNPRMDALIWSGGAVEELMSFASLCLIAFMAWSILWISAKSLSSTIAKATSDRAASHSKHTDTDTDDYASLESKVESPSR